MTRLWRRFADATSRVDPAHPELTQERTSKASGLCPSLIELAATVGLLTTTWLPTLGDLAAAGAVVYFAGAVIAHVRKHDAIAEIAPALFLTLVSAITVYTISAGF